MECLYVLIGMFCKAPENNLDWLGAIWILVHDVLLLLQGTDMNMNQYMVSSAYTAAPNSGEITLQEGDIVQVSRFEGEGWWYVHHRATGAQGWAPSNHLTSTKRNSASYSSTVSSLSSTSVGKVIWSFFYFSTARDLHLALSPWLCYPNRNRYRVYPSWNFSP